MGPRSLDGILVVEFGARVAVGVCGSLLAQLGAQTIFVELMPPQDAPSKWDHRAAFAAGKLSFRPDFASSTDIDLLNRLVERADVVLISSDIDKPLSAILSTGWDDKPIVCDMTAYGRTGPLAGRADTDWQIQALAGIVDTTGMSDGPPVPSPLPVVEYMTGVYAASAVLVALRVKRLSGIGQHIDMALYDCAFAAMATFLPAALTGDKAPVERAGNRHAMISPWNVYLANDGWILICAGSNSQWRRLCEVMDREDLAADARYAAIADRVACRAEVDDLVQGWTSARSVAECAQALEDAAIASGAIVPIRPHPLEPNLEHREMIRCVAAPGGEVTFPGSPMHMSRTPGIAPARIPAPDEDRQKVEEVATSSLAPTPVVQRNPAQPLSGIRVVEIGHYTTVPLSTRHMGALGAEVIKVEPPEGEATRGWLPAHDGQGYFFTYMNSDKRSICLDLRQEADAAHLRELIAGADVLMENLKPGALARRGFSAQEIASINPRLVYCAVSGFGHDSLYAGRPAYDSVIQAMSGVMDIVRSAGVPVKTGISIADLLGAEAALLGVLAALEHRDRTGEGQFVDISMQDMSAWMTQLAWNGGVLPALAIVRCSDGYQLAECEAGWLHVKLKDDVCDAGNGLSTDLSRADLASRLKEHTVRSAPVNTVHDAIAMAEKGGRELFFEVEARGTHWPLMASPLRLGRTPPRVRDPMPALGQDNEAILGAAAATPEGKSKAAG